MSFSTAFQANAFQNNAFQINVALGQGNAILSNAGIGAVAEPETIIDFRKSDRARAKEEARKAADKADLKRIIHEAYYGKPAEDVADFLNELIEENIGPSEAVMELAALQSELMERQEQQRVQDIHNRHALDLLLLVS